MINLEQHWFTLRRFGPVGLDFHWVNLNSVLKRPEPVSNTFLGMMIQQAEQEGMLHTHHQTAVSTYVSEEVSTFQDPSPLVTDYPPIFQREVEAANPPTPSSPPARRSIRLAKHYRSDGAPSPLCGVQRRVKRKRVDDADDAKKDTKDTKDTQVLKKIKTEPESIQL